MSDEEFEAIMRQWDSWRKYIAEGGGGSWPRDAFEALLEGLQERTEQAEHERDALREALIDARENIVEWAGYADAYFKDKYDYAGDLAAIDAALEAEGG